MDQSSRKQQTSKISVGSSRRSNLSGCMSLQRLSYTLREPSLNNRSSLVYVMSIESERKSDLFQRLLGSDNNKNRVRLSVNQNNTQIEHYHNNGYDGYEIPINNNNQLQRALNHTCTCYEDCQKQSCPCFDAKDEICLKQHCCDQCIQLKIYSLQNNRNTCTCKNTKCLKSYCKCFQNGGFCSQNCKCEDCSNKTQSAERTQALQNMMQNMSKNQMFCTCKKTKCNKKYCSCFANGLKCSSQCCCEGCTNQQIRQDQEMDIQPNICYDGVNIDVEFPDNMEFQPVNFESK